MKSPYGSHHVLSLLLTTLIAACAEESLTSPKKSSVNLSARTGIPVRVLESAECEGICRFYSDRAESIRQICIDDGFELNRPEDGVIFAKDIDMKIRGEIEVTTTRKTRIKSIDENGIVMFTDDYKEEKETRPKNVVVQCKGTEYILQ